MQSDAPSPTTGVHSPEVEATDTESNLADEERTPRSTNGHSHPSRSSHTQIASERDDIEHPHSPSSGPATAVKDVTQFIKKTTSQLLDVISSGSSGAGISLSPQLASLVQAFAESDILAEINSDIEAAKQRPDQVGEPDAIHLREALDDSSTIRGRRRASYTTQFRILSGRAFKNLYRNPALLTAHYISSITVARK